MGEKGNKKIKEKKKKKKKNKGETWRETSCIYMLLSQGGNQIQGNKDEKNGIGSFSGYEVISKALLYSQMRISQNGCTKRIYHKPNKSSFTWEILAIIPFSDL